MEQGWRKTGVVGIRLLVRWTTKRSKEYVFLKGTLGGTEEVYEIF